MCETPIEKESTDKMAPIKKDAPIANFVARVNAKTMVIASIVMLLLSVTILNAWGFADMGASNSLQIAGDKSSKPA